MSFIVIIPQFIQRRGKRADAVGHLAPGDRDSGRPMSRRGTSSRPSAWPSDAPEIAEARPGVAQSKSDAGRRVACALAWKTNRPVTQRLVSLMQRKRELSDLATGLICSVSNR